MTFENFIFDLDGTLVDSLDGIEASVAEALRICFPDREIPNLREQIGPPIGKMFARMFPDLDFAEIEKLVAVFRRHYDDEGCVLSRLYPGVEETLATLSARGSKLFVLTNKPQHATRVILEQNSILRFFTEVVSPDTTTPPFSVKTEAAQALGERWRLAPATTALIGDGRDDCAAARASGFAFILAKYGYGAAALDGSAEAVAALNTFSEILFLPPEP
jgi:phosphoglycolate phosphatase